MLRSNKNDKKQIIQASGYNGSELMRACPNCRMKKHLTNLAIEI